MGAYKFKGTVDENKVFVVSLSEIKGRLDSSYNFYLRKGEFKSIFPLFKISDICNSISGGTPSKENKTFWNGNIPWASPKDIKSFYLDKTIDSITELGVKNSSTKVIEPNNLIIVFRALKEGELNSSITKRSVAINQDLKALYFKENVLPEYILILFKIFQKQLFPLITKKGTTVYSMNTIEFESLKIPLPPLNIQNQIVTQYQKAYQEKKEKEQQAKELLASIDTYLLNELGIILPQKENSLDSRMFKSVFSDVSNSRLDPDYHRLGYKMIEKSILNSKYITDDLKNLTIVLNSGTTPSKSPYSKEVSDFPIIKVGSYSNNYIDLEKVDYCLFKQNLKVKRGDIFILSAAHQSEYVGKHIKYLNEEPNIPTSYVGELICVRANQRINSMYLFSLLNLSMYKTLINKEKTGQTSHIYGKDLKLIKIPLPSLEKQNEIAEHITNLRTQARQLQQEAKDVLENTKKDIEQQILGV